MNPNIAPPTRVMTAAPGVVATPPTWIGQDGHEHRLDVVTAKPPATPVPLGQRIELSGPMPVESGLALEPGTTATFLSPDDDAQPVWILALNLSSNAPRGEGTAAP